MPRPIIRIAWLIVVGLLSSVAAFGQTTSVVNPTTVQFTPSADNSAVTSDGLPVVVRYDLQIYVQTTTTPYTTVNLGKPAVGSDGTMQVDFSALMANWPLPDGTYDARVVAIGQSGVGQSDLSNVFTFQAGTGTPPTCTYGLSATSWAAGAAGGTFTVNVAASSSGCGWTALGTSTWATVSPASGTGSGIVTVTVAPNTGSARTAVLTIAGQTFTVTQAAVACTYALASTSWGVSAIGGNGSVGVTASASTCGWTATSEASWLTVSPASGSGSGTVTMTAAANTGSARTAMLTIAGQTYTVTQAAVACTYALSSTTWRRVGHRWRRQRGGDGERLDLRLDGVEQRDVGDGESGQRHGIRHGHDDGGGQHGVGADGDADDWRPDVHGDSGAVSCTYALSASTLSAAATGATSGVTVTANLGTCGWTASSNAAWATVSPIERDGLRHGDGHRRGEHGRGADGDADDRRSDLHGEPGCRRPAVTRCRPALCPRRRRGRRAA